ncbi:extracellular solute-binding protein [Paenibacillus filicis]|uniref:Extracellular solute-binding protein n=1 Tax=Paenibacillus gyeongsangnamensis TaxID=3388067 RepID=A0ABT4Q382_9BACL|nr:extracellular solute-binding protein [Paenibacillus filicis]MCZ8511292.1 extracellular solute-binding protein [Paenibacillus filicis]
MNKFSKNALLLSVCGALTVPMLSACTIKSASSDKSQHVLRIATSMGYNPEDDYFRQRFTELFEFANPNIKLEFVPTTDPNMMYARPEPNQKRTDPYQKLKEVMQGDNPPDVVMVGYEQLSDLIGNNMLTDLSANITKDKFDTSDIVPAVIDGLKKMGDGKLYALAPTFSSSALIYNKKMFDDAGVPYPKDKMTWEEVFDLSRRLSKGDGENRKYGFSFSTQNMGGDLYYASQVYSAPLQLKTFDDKGEKMTVDSDQWEQVWKTLLQLKTEKLVPEQQEQAAMRAKMQAGEYNPLQYDDFLSSRVAMAIINYGQINQLTNQMKSAQAQNLKGFTPFEWDVVTLPIHQQAPDMGGYIYMDGIMGINAKAQNVEDAWKYIKFINSEEWAKLKSSSTYNLVSRKKYIKPKDGLNFHIEAFTMLSPVPMTDNKLYREKPNLYQVNSIGQQKFQQVVSGNLKVREALKQWATEGDVMLQQIKENPDAPLKPVPMK